MLSRMKKKKTGRLLKEARKGGSRSFDGNDDDVFTTSTSTAELNVVKRVDWKWTGCRNVDSPSTRSDTKKSVYDILRPNGGVVLD